MNNLHMRHYHLPEEASESYIHLSYTTLSNLLVPDNSQSLNTLVGVTTVGKQTAQSRHSRICC